MLITVGTVPNQRWGASSAPQCGGSGGFRSCLTARIAILRCQLLVLHHFPLLDQPLRTVLFIAAVLALRQI